MPDYKGMYLTMVRETEKAIRILEAARRAARSCICKAKNRSWWSCHGRTQIEKKLSDMQRASFFNLVVTPKSP